MAEDEKRSIVRASSEPERSEPRLSLTSEQADCDIMNDAISPTFSTSSTSQSFIRRVKRRLSLRARSRKDSSTSLASLNLELAYSLLREKYGHPSESDAPQLGEEREQLYRELLGVVIHPLGASDHTVGLRPGDLVDHLKDVFDLERGVHEFFVREVLANKPKHVQLNASLIEAKLRPNDATPTQDPYCILSIVNPYKNSRSPRSSPKNSPRSPRKKNSANRPSSAEFDGDVKQSQPAKGGPNPCWNESFEIDVGEIGSDELHIYIWNSNLGETGPDAQPPANFHRTPSIRKSIFKQIRHMVEHDKTKDYHGSLVLPLKEISVSGSERWYDIMKKCSITGKPKSSGRINLSLSLSLKNLSEFESTEDVCHIDTPCIDIYYQALKQVLHYMASQNKSSNCGIIDGNLCEKSAKTLLLYAVSHRISKLSQAMLYLITLLEWSLSGDDAVVTDTALLKAIDQLHMTWLSMQHSSQTNLMQKMPLTDSEIGMFRRAVKEYADHTMKNVDHLGSLYPPSTDVITCLNSNLGILIQLLQLDLWDDKTSPMQDVTQACMHKLQADTNKWIDTQLENIAIHDVSVRDSVIPEMTALIDLINSMVSHCTPLGVVKQFFNNVNINYYKLTSVIVDAKISRVAQSLLYELDKYQVRYHKYHVNINASSRLSLSLYFCVRKLFQAILSNSSPRDVFKLSLANYQSWFKEVLVFWLQTFRTECLARMDRALEIDKDVVLVTTMAKYSNSAVDVVSCFNIITEEWRQIEYNDADSVLMGVTKITDLICDGARLYADRVHTILERNCYYDDAFSKFDITDRLCITLNNIEHVRRYMNELPTLLSWDAVHAAVSAKHGGSHVGQQALKTLYRLSKSAHRDILLKSTVLVKEITERMKENIFKYMEQFTRINPDKLSSIDAVLDYMSRNTETLTKRLVTSIYPVFMENLWFTVLVIFDEQLMSGQTPEYYETMKRHLRSLSLYFVRGGMEEERINSPISVSIRQRLQLNSQPTSDLVLQYYSDLANQCDTPVDYFGHVAIRVAFLEETRGNVTLFIKIIRASDLPGLDVGGLSDPYIVVTLRPDHLFPYTTPCRTQIMYKTLNPVFNCTFQFPNIPKDMLSQTGAVFHVSILDHDHFGTDDFAGEVFIHLNQISSIEMHEHVDTLPVLILPLKRPINQAGPFQILRERIQWDKLAKRVVAERVKVIENRMDRTDSPASPRKSFLSFFSSLFS